MAFIAERLLDCIAYGATGGPTFRTRKVEMKNGRVLRNADWSRAMHHYTASYQNIDQADHAEVVAAFHTTQGSAHGFLWWDRADYQATGEDIGIATGSPQTLQLTKTYGFGSSTVVRPIRKPRAGFTIKKQGVPFTPTSIDYTTGLVTFTAIVGAVISWTGEFDVPVTFESDELFFSIDSRNAGGYRLTSDFALIEDFTE